MFVLNSDITIGNFHFSGVNAVQVNRSLHSISETAIIKIPSMAKVVKGGKASPVSVITAGQFNDGDLVTIKLGYNGDLKTEFIGFVKRRDLGMPLSIVCEGYSWLLGRNKVNISLATVTLKDLLSMAVKGIDQQYSITIRCDLDLTFINVLVNGSGLDIITFIEKYTDGCVRCFFISPDVLWCGLLYTPVASGDDVFGLGAVQYKPGFNVMKDNDLKQRTSADSPVLVTYNKRLADGTLLSGVSDVFNGKGTNHSRLLNHLNDAGILKQLANEKAYLFNYSGYEGGMQTFLQPYASPGYLAYITDSRYSERDGTYIIESVRTSFGINGATRIVEVGPRAGFAN